ncbi:GNAT family N-acetyltransferase [Vibrio mangrovi]|uniref:Acetyltransferase (GNAT) family protein n=1 Tax=Vibrio mangrovi TaxID=474394 RepID=A0A1Y6IYS9_9VIBR|nr:GNAT family N-acetyltransferase [Vibrio mangrovi]MDW6002655.1 GNAT family N-acetyltransferase [Vibrio mangrovi]SMS02814.1 Acetyltransferase (GNAT) family protein [Vibrio mangrovi]
MMKAFACDSVTGHPLLRKRKTCACGREADHTGILYLKALQLSDADYLLTLFSKPVWDNLGLKPIHTLQRACSFIRGEGSNQDRRFGVWHTEHGLIGSVAYGVHAKEVFISYWITPLFQGQGYGREAVGLLLSLIEQHDVDFILADVYHDNLPSQALLQSIGFRQYECLGKHRQRPAIRWIKMVR